MSCPYNNSSSSDINKNIAQLGSIASQLNINKCMTNNVDSQTQSQYSGKAGGFSLDMLGGAGAEWEGSSSSSYTDNSTVGCGALNLLLQTYQNTVNQVKCKLTSNTSDISTTTTASGNIIINVDNFIAGQNCPITSNVSLSANVITGITNSVANDIKSAIQNNLQNFTTALANTNPPYYSKSGAGATAINNVNQNITSNLTNAQITNSINNVTVTTDASGNITIGNGHGTFTCNSPITSNVQVDIIAQTMVQDCLSSVFKNINMNELMPPPPPQIIQPPENPVVKYGVIFIVLILVIFILYKLYEKFSHTKPHTNMNMNMHFRFY